METRIKPVKAPEIIGTGIPDYLYMYPAENESPVKPTLINKQYVVCLVKIDINTLLPKFQFKF